MPTLQGWGGGCACAKIIVATVAGLIVATWPLWLPHAPLLARVQGCPVAPLPSGFELRFDSWGGVCKKNWPGLGLCSWIRTMTMRLGPATVVAGRSYHCLACLERSGVGQGLCTVVHWLPAVVGGGGGVKGC